MSTTPGITPATFEPSLGAKLNNETDRQEEVHTLMTAKGQPRAIPETGSAESTQNDQKPLATSPAFVYTRKPTSGFLSILNEEPINIEAKTQRLAALLTVEAEPMTAMRFLRERILPTSPTSRYCSASNLKRRTTDQEHLTTSTSTTYTPTTSPQTRSSHWKCEMRYLFTTKVYVECRMFSLYGASRDNDRCCARFGDCEISQLVPSKGTSQIRNIDWTVESYSF